MENNKKIIMGLDISTVCIGICLLEYDENSEYGKILELTHVNPKVPRKVKGIEALFLKKKIFNEQFLSRWKDIGISKVVIESPLLSSNNVNTVSTLLQFNGMISDCVYNILGIVPEYISSYDARKYSFPEFMAIRKYDKEGEKYDNKKIIKSVKKSQYMLFGAYPWDIDKKELIQAKVAEIFPDIQWLTSKKGELKKENFDACDAYVACLGALHKEKYGELSPKTLNLTIKDNIIEFDMSFWGETHHKQIHLEK